MFVFTLSFAKKGKKNREFFVFSADTKLHFLYLSMKIQSFFGSFLGARPVSRCSFLLLGKHILWLYCVTFPFFIYFIFFSFLVIESNLEIFCILEIRSFLISFLYLKSSTKENINAFSYLFGFSCFLGLTFLGNFSRRQVSVGLYSFFIRISVGVIIFFSKLPIYFLHHWLPKAHVEVVTCGSAILARLMLKFRIPFLARFWDEVFFRLLVGFFALFSMMNTGDYKVFVAYSSIIHITVFCFLFRPQAIVYLYFWLLYSASYAFVRKNVLIFWWSL